MPSLRCWIWSVLLTLVLDALWGFATPETWQSRQWCLTPPLLDGSYFAYGNGLRGALMFAAGILLRAIVLLPVPVVVGQMRKKAAFGQTITAAWQSQWSVLKFYFCCVLAWVVLGFVIATFKPVGPSNATALFPTKIFEFGLPPAEPPEVPAEDFIRLVAAGELEVAEHYLAQRDMASFFSMANLGQTLASRTKKVELVSDTRGILSAHTQFELGSLDLTIILSRRARDWVVADWFAEAHKD